MTLLLPLALMLGSYITIIIVIYRRSQQSQVFGGSNTCQGVIRKAKFQTIKVTGVLVLGFILCWTPYYSMTLW